MPPKTNLLKYLVGITFLLFCCTLQTTHAQVPETPVKEVPPPPPPPPEPEVEEIFTVVEEMPRFPGCPDSLSNEEKRRCAEEKMYDYIYENLEYPKLAKENGIEGTVVVRFYVDKDHTLKGLTLLKDIGAGCGKEAMRLVEGLTNIFPNKRWVPGKSRGKPVKVYFNLPIEFDLDA